MHRIGRTARAGASGIAISLVSSDEMPFLRDIEKLIRQPVPMTIDARSHATNESPEDGRGPRQRRGREDAGEHHHRERSEHNRA